MNIKRTKVRRIGVVSMATTYALFMVALGIIIVLIYALFGALFLGLAGFSAGGSSGGPNPIEMFGAGTVGMILALVIIPLFYGAIGFVFGAIGALIYNLVAKMTGGVELELMDREGAGPSQ